MKTLDVEILAIGKWNNIDITRKHMEEIVTNFTKLKDVVQVFLKLGHNKEQPMTDGQPALGWVDALNINDANKLVATFTDLPDIIYNALKKKLYRNVSIEFLMDVKHKGIEYGTILEAVALLGADVPAVNTLSDLQAYMSRGNGLEFSSHVEFSTIRGSIKEDIIMPKTVAELEVELEQQKAINTAQATQITLSAKNDTEKDTKIKTLEASAESTKAETAKVEFVRRTESVTADLEALVKSKTITPAKRDELIKEFTIENAEKVEFAVATFKDLAPVVKDTDSHVKGGDHKSEEDDDKPADARLHLKAVKFSSEHKVDYKDAVNSVMESEPELAREYLDQMEA